jgi:hypothetical protein
MRSVRRRAATSKRRSRQFEFGENEVRFADITGEPPPTILARNGHLSSSTNAENASFEPPEWDFEPPDTKIGSPYLSDI